MASGEVECPRCKDDLPTIANDMRLRTRQPGMLVPDILFNDVPTELSLEGKPLEVLLVEDAKCDLLLVIGTSLQSRGAAIVTKALARQVHDHCGAVVYVNANSLAPSTWGKYIDLHVQADIEEWARDCTNTSDGTSSEVTHIVVAEEIMSLVAQLNTRLRDRVVEPQHMHRQPALTYASEYAISTSGSLGSGDPGTQGVQCGAAPNISVLLLIYHHSWATFEAQALGEMLVATVNIMSSNCKEMSGR
ncbi:hypothetical protein FS749_008630 [Ceratobasidium sp. UAMH 11750]|nr:hypothetical protein FS749_008630 [Ceratobasidium sp. UAMH 11750]